MAKGTCSVEGCEGAVVARTWCAKHYRGWQRTGSPTGSTRVGPEARFWQKVEVTDTGCWEWSACRDSKGYGRFNPARSTVFAHRFSWELHNGPIPDGLHVLHRCDNPPCCNPAHLFLGTHRDNTEDCFAKGRVAGQKLTPQDHADIRAAHGTVPQVELARRYAVSAWHICYVINGHRWAP